MMNKCLSTALLAVFCLASAPAAKATLVGESVDVSLITGSTFGPDTVTVVPPGAEIVKNDATAIGTFFGEDSGSGGDVFDSASINIEALSISINIDLFDGFSLLSGANILNSAIFQFDLLTFSNGLPMQSVNLISDDPYFNTAINNCVLSDCVEFDSNTIQVEITTPTLTAFSYIVSITQGLQPVPEPSSFVLLVGGLLGAAIVRRRSRKA